MKNDLLARSAAVCVPASDVLYQFGAASELAPQEIDLASVRRYRDVELRGLGKPLESYRDNEITLPIYAPGGKAAGDLLGLRTRFKHRLNPMQNRLFLSRKSQWPMDKSTSSLFQWRFCSQPRFQPALRRRLTVVESRRCENKNSQ